MADRSVVVRLIADVNGFTAGMTKAAASTSQVDSAVETTSARVEKASARVAASRKVEADAAGRVKVAEAQLDELRSSSSAKATQLAAAEERLSKAQRDQALAAQRTAVAQRELQEPSAAATRSSEAMAAASVKSAEAQKEASGASAALKEFGGLSSIAGVGMMGLAGGLGYAVKEFSEFDHEMASVRANIGATGAEANKLGDYVRNAGTKFGFSASQSAQATDDLAKAGLNTSQVMGGALTSALALAAAGNVSTGESAEMLATTMSQYGIKVKTAADASREYGHAADLIAAGADKSTASVHSISEGLQNVGGVAHQFGMNMQDTVGVLAEFDQSGLKGAEAGTAMKVMLQQLVNPSKDVQGAFKEYNIQAFDAQGNFKGMANLANELKTKLSGLSQEQRMNALSTMFGTHAIQAASILYKDGAAGVEKWSAVVNQSGFAAQNASKKTDSLQGDMNKLKAAVNSAFIEIGSSANGPLRFMVQGLTDFVNVLGPVIGTVGKMAAFFGSLPSPIRDAALALAAFRVAGSLMGDSLNGVKSKVSSFGSSLKEIVTAQGTVVESSSRTERALSSFGASISKMGESSTTISKMQSAFDEASAGASRFPRAAGAANAGMSLLKSGATGLVGALGGPWGLAIGAATVGLSMWSDHQQQAAAKVAAHKAEVQQLTGAVSSSGQVMSDAAKDTISKALADQGAFEAGQKLHLSMTDVMMAAQGYTPAVQKMNDAVQKYGTVQNEGGAIAEQSGERQVQLTGTAKKLTDAVKEQSKAAQDAAKAQQVHKVAMDATASSFDAEGHSADAAKQAIDDYADAQKQAKDANDAMRASLDKMNNTFLELRGGARGYEASIDDATKALQENGRTLDINTEKGRANGEALDKVASSAATMISDMSKNGSSAAQISAQYGQSRAELLKLAESFGMTADQAKAYVDQALKIPDTVTTAVSADTTQAEKALGTIKDDAKKIDGSKLTIQAKALDADKTKAILDGLPGVTKDAHGNVTIDTKALNADQTKAVLSSIPGVTKQQNGSLTVDTKTSNVAKVRAELAGITNAAVTADGKIVTIPVSAPNAAQVKQILEGVHNAQVSADGKKVTITTSAPMADDTKKKINAIKGAQVSADGKSVTISTSAATAPATKRLIDDLNNARKATDGKSAKVNASAPGADDAKNKVNSLGNAADKVNGKHATVTIEQVFKTIGSMASGAVHAIGSIFGGATGGAISDLRSIPGFANGGMLGSINGIPYGWQDGRTGGKVVGPGTSTSDQVVTMTSRGLVRTANDEHIIAGDEVAGFGGHAGIYRLRALAKSGSLPRFADGGSVGGTDWDPDMSGIMQLISSMRVDPSKVGDDKGKMTSAQQALAKATRDLNAARVRMASLTKKSTHEQRVKAANAVTDALVKQKNAQNALNTATRTYTSTASAAKADTADLFVRASAKDNGTSKQFLDDIQSIQKKGFPGLAYSLLQQGDDDAKVAARDFASGSLSRLKSAAANLKTSDALADRKQTMLDQLSGKTSSATLTATAQQQANAQLLAMRGANTTMQFTGGAIRNSGYAQFPTRELVEALAAQMPKMPDKIVVQTHMDGRLVGSTVTNFQATQASIGSVIPGLK